METHRSSKSLIEGEYYSVKGCHNYAQYPCDYGRRLMCFRLILTQYLKGDYSLGRKHANYYLIVMHDELCQQ